MGEISFPARQATTLVARHRRECRSWAALERSAVSVLRNLANAREHCSNQAARSSVPMRYCFVGISFVSAGLGALVTIQSRRTQSNSIALGFARGLNSYLLSRAPSSPKWLPRFLPGLLETLKHYAAPDNERSRIFDPAAFRHGMRWNQNPREARRLGARGASSVSERKSYARPRVD